MPSYTAPTKDMQYVLHDVLKITDAGIAGYEDLDRDFTAAILEEAGKISAEVLAPLNPVGDTEGCRLENGIVYTPDGLQGRLRADEGERLARHRHARGIRRTGPALPDEHRGGRDVLGRQQAFTMYQGLTHGAASAIIAHGTDEQKAKPGFPRWCPATGPAP
jgi:hypothetical protein